MKKIAIFCIPAHGHTNPILPVAAELVKRGNMVRFYSFSEFEAKIRATGVEYISCDKFLPELSEEQATNLKESSTTEMTIQDIRITLCMNEFIENEFKTFKPDVVYTDSVCFWGKLNALKYDIPMVVSTSTFAFNQMSSQYMKNTPKEMCGLIFGLPKVTKELNKLNAYGYKHKGLFSLIQSDNDTDSVVYTSRYFQPYSESFSKHYCFVGPSVFSDKIPKKDNERPLVYISLGTVVNNRPDFYKNCIKAFGGENMDVIISCGTSVDISSFGEIPENIKVYQRVDQLDVLSRANAFVTHCGMNSVSESLYMATPMVLFPQTNEQKAVARRAMEIGAGTELKNDSVNSIKEAVKTILGNDSYKTAAKKCSDDFRSCSGPEGAADFIESAPHTSDEVDIIKLLGKANVRNQVLYNVAAILIANILFRFVDIKFLWIYIVAAVILSSPINKVLQKIEYERLNRKYIS